MMLHIIIGTTRVWFTKSRPNIEGCNRFKSVKFLISPKLKETMTLEEWPHRLHCKEQVQFPYKTYSQQSKYQSCCDNQRGHQTVMDSK